MKGTQFIKALPTRESPERESAILDAVRRRDIAPIKWSPITTTFTNGQGHSYTAKFLVSQDALRVGDASDSVRVSTRHDTAQRIADDLGVVLPTAKLSDEIWNQATIRLPSNKQQRDWYLDSSMSHTARMLEQHNLIEKLVSDEQFKTGKQGLIADVGKDWVTTLRLWQPYTGGGEVGNVRAANYGWHSFGSPSATLPGVNVSQPIGLAHTIGHTDYSQVIRLVRREVKICGPGMGEAGCATLDIDQIITDPALAGLVSHEGPLEQMRHPAVERSCDPSSRCVKNFVDGATARSFCYQNCDKTAPPAPDPTAGMPRPAPRPTPGPTPAMGTASPTATAGVSYLPAALAAAAGFAGVMWLVSR